MSRTLVKHTGLDIDGREYALSFYEHETATVYSRLLAGRKPVAA